MARSFFRNSADEQSREFSSASIADLAPMGLGCYLRRFLAALLLTLIVSPTIGLLFASEPESSLPTCCRRNGKHHCAMMMRFDSSSGPSLAPAPCPCFPNVKLIPANRTPFLTPAPQAFFTGLIPRLNLRRCTASLGRQSFSRGHHKRGPPALFT